MTGKPFSAYAGDEAYLFASYSHQDAAEVYPELEWLRAQAFNVWYDDGIRAGRDWADELATALASASALVLFVTPNSVASQHCRDEVNLALNQGKPVIPVYLKPSELSPGLSLRLSSQQAILRFEQTRDRYQQQLVSALTEHMLKAAGGHTQVSQSGYAHVPGAHQAPSAPNAIAVLPFVNRSSDPNNEYFSESMSEEILNALVKTNAMPVIARTSSFQFKNRDASVQEIAATLGVGYLLEGSVQKVGNAARISAQLIEANTAVQIWSNRFDRELDNVFALQDEIAQAIVEQVQHHLGLRQVNGAKAGREEVDATSYDLFLRAKHHMRQVTRADQDKAVELLKQVVALEPGYAAGWATLGWAYLVYAFLAVTPPVEVAELARPALTRALTLEPDNPLALAIMGYIQATVEYRWDEGEAMLRHAARLAPGDTVVQMALGVYLYATFQLPEAREVIESAYRLDPLSDLTVSWYADILDATGRQSDAKRVLSAFLDTGVPGADHLMASIFVRMGDPERARQEIEQFRRKWGEDNGTVRVLEYTLARLERSADAALIYGDLEQRLARREYMTYWWGGQSNIVQRLEAAYHNRWIGTVQLLAVYPNRRLDTFRQRMNLAALSGKSFPHPRARPAAQTERLRAGSIELPGQTLDRYVGTYAGKGLATLRVFREGSNLNLHNLNSDAMHTLITLDEKTFAHPELIYRYEFQDDRLEELDGQVYLHRQRTEDVSRDPASAEAVAAGAMTLDQTALQRYAGTYEDRYGWRLEIDAGDGRLGCTSQAGAFMTLIPVAEGEFAALELKDVTGSFRHDGSGSWVLTLSRPYAKPTKSEWRLLLDPGIAANQHQKENR